MYLVTFLWADANSWNVFVKSEKSHSVIIHYWTYGFNWFCERYSFSGFVSIYSDLFEYIFIHVDNSIWRSLREIHYFFIDSLKYMKKCRKNYVNSKEIISTDSTWRHWDFSGDIRLQCYMLIFIIVFWIR